VRDWKTLPQGSGRHCLVQYYTTSIGNFFFLVVQEPLAGQGLLNIEASRSHSDTPHSVGLPWTRDQPVAETSTWQYITRDKYPRSCGIRTHNASSWAPADPRLRPRGHWDRLINSGRIFEGSYICLFSKSICFTEKMKAQCSLRKQVTIY